MSPRPLQPPPRQAQSHNEREDLWWARGGRGWPWCRGAAATRQLGTQQVFSVSCLLVVVVGLDGRALARRDPWEASRAARHKRHVSVVPHHHLPPFFCTAPVENSSKGARSCLLLLEDLDLLPPPPLHHRQRTRTRPQPSFSTSTSSAPRACCPAQQRGGSSKSLPKRREDTTQHTHTPPMGQGRLPSPNAVMLQAPCSFPQMACSPRGAHASAPRLCHHHRPPAHTTPCAAMSSASLPHWLTPISLPTPSTSEHQNRRGPPLHTDQSHHKA